MFKWYRNISIARKLFWAAVIMVLLITFELFTIWISFSTLSSVRTLVASEGYLSKGQKNAIYYLVKYVRSGNEEDYKNYLRFLSIPLASERAIDELKKKNLDKEMFRKRLLEAGNQPDEAIGLSNLFTRFINTNYIKEAIAAGVEAAALVSELEKSATQIHSENLAGGLVSNQARIEQFLNKIDDLNARLNAVQDPFSVKLGEGAARLENFILMFLFFTSLTVGLIVASLGISIATGMRKGIKEIIRLTPKIAARDFRERATVYSKDEIGSLATAFNKMTDELELSVNVVKESEKQVQAFFDNAPDAVIVINAQGEIVRWNHRAEPIFGWRAEEVIGKQIHEIIIPERYRDAHKNGLEHFIETKEGPILNKPVEFSALRRNKTEFEAGIIISPTIFKGEYLFIGFVSDITARKSSEILIQKKSEELIRSNKELEQFVYVASHDLQEPLRMVTSFLQLLEKKLEGKLDDEAKEFIGFAVDGSNRMKQMIEDLLSYSRLISSKLKFEKIDVGELIGEVKDSLRQSIKEAGATIVLNKMPVAAADKDKLLRIFRNLISNTIKFRKKDRALVVEISCEEGPEHYQFSVKDNGIGIRKEHQEKLFKIFQRLHAKQEYPGTGIGLAECRKIAELHGGNIWVESEVDKGTTFYFTIKKTALNGRSELEDNAAVFPSPQDVSGEQENIKKFPPRRAKVLAGSLLLVTLSGTALIQSGSGLSCFHMIKPDAAPTTHIYATSMPDLDLSGSIASNVSHPIYPNPGCQL